MSAERVAPSNQELADERELQLAIAGGDSHSWAAIRAAFDWGYSLGWREGFNRSFGRVGKPIDMPTLEEAAAARGEVQVADGTCRTIPRASDRPGGRVDPW